MTVDSFIKEDKNGFHVIVLCYYQLSEEPDKEGDASRDGESIPVDRFNGKKAEELIKTCN